MIRKARFSKAVALLTTLAVLACLALIVAAHVTGPADTGVAMAYESKLFDTTTPLQLNIAIDEDDWADLLENALDETYYRCQVTINGTVFSNVGIRAKGNTSLSRIAGDPDSLSGSMAHNYYLYEQNGKLNLIPWDYNLAWGGFSQGKVSATDTVNFAIDTPFSSGISTEDRTFFMALLENETYREQYHTYLRQLCEEYVSGGRLETTYTRIRGQIDELVATDPTAFYSYEEYDTAAQMLRRVLALRAESVRGQLNGTIPSSNEAQQADPASLLDASSLDLSVMGTMDGEGGGQNGGRFTADPARIAEGNPATAGDAAVTSPTPTADSEATSSSSAPSTSTSSASKATGESQADSGQSSTDSSTGDTAGTVANGFRPSDNPGSQGGLPPSGDQDNRGGSHLAGGAGGETAGTASYSAASLLTVGLCFLAILAALAIASRFRRGPKHHA